MSYERLPPDNAAVLFVDHQAGLSNGVQDQSQPEYVAAVTALAETAKAFGLPARPNINEQHRGPAVQKYESE